MRKTEQLPTRHTELKSHLGRKLERMQTKWKQVARARVSMTGQKGVECIAAFGLRLQLDLAAKITKETNPEKILAREGVLSLRRLMSSQGSCTKY